MPFHRSRASHSEAPCESTLSHHDQSGPEASPIASGAATISSISAARARMESRTRAGASRAAMASSVSTPGVCHSKRPPRSAFSSRLTSSWHRPRRSTRGSSQLIQRFASCSGSAALRVALRWIPQPEMAMNIGAAMPPIAAATNAAGWPTVTPSGGTIAAVWTSTMHSTAMARMRSMCLSLIQSSPRFAIPASLLHRIG